MSSKKSEPNAAPRKDRGEDNWLLKRHEEMVHSAGYNALVGKRRDLPAWGSRLEILNQIETNVSIKYTCTLISHYLITADVFGNKE